MRLRLLLADILKDMVYESRLSDASRRDEDDVALILQSLHDEIRLFLAVAEVFCSLISVDNKWVIQLFHNVLYLFHVLCYIFYEMQRYDFLCNYHHSFPNNF